MFHAKTRREINLSHGRIGGHSFYQTKRKSNTSTRRSFPMDGWTAGTSAVSRSRFYTRQSNRWGLLRITRESFPPRRPKSQSQLHTSERRRQQAVSPAVVGSTDLNPRLRFGSTKITRPWTWRNQDLFSDSETDIVTNSPLVA
jgi:hypothetical protein